MPGGARGRRADQGRSDPEGAAAVHGEVASRTQDLRGTGSRGAGPVAGYRPAHHPGETGEGKKPRIVPVHAEMHSALTSALQFGNVGQVDRLIMASRSTADRWIKAAAARAGELGAIPPGCHISNHTLRHSYARHLLVHGIPINYLYRWLRHSSTWSSSWIRPEAWCRCRDRLELLAAGEAKLMLRPVWAWRFTVRL